MSSLWCWMIRAHRSQSWVVLSGDTGWDESWLVNVLVASHDDAKGRLTAIPPIEVLLQFMFCVGRV